MTTMVTSGSMAPRAMAQGLQMVPLLGRFRRKYATGRRLPEFRCLHAQFALGSVVVLAATQAASSPTILESTSGTMSSNKALLLRVVLVVVFIRSAEK